EDGWLAVVAQQVEQLLGALAEFDTALTLRVSRIVVPYLVEMGELGADAAQIVPDAGENLLDFLRRLLRESGGQVVAADAVLAHPAADHARGATEEFRGLVRIEIACGAQHCDRGAADRGLRDGLEGIAQTRADTKEQAVHRQMLRERLRRFPRQDQRC